MRSIHVKAMLLAAAIMILAVESIFLYKFYRDNYNMSNNFTGEDLASRDSTTSGIETTMRENTSPETTISGDSGNEAAVSAGGTTFVHRATPGSTSMNSTFLNDPRFNGDPDAILLVSRISDSGDAGENAPEIGVWYYDRGGKWAIFNQDLALMPDDAAFRVTVADESGAFVHRATPANTVANTTYIDDPIINGAPKVDLSVTQNWNPGGGQGTYNDHPVGVFYDEDLGQWAIFNRDSAPMPQDTAFNVAVSLGQ